MRLADCHCWVILMLRTHLLLIPYTLCFIKNHDILDRRFIMHHIISLECKATLNQSIDGCLCLTVVLLLRLDTALQCFAQDLDERPIT